MTTANIWNLTLSLHIQREHVFTAIGVLNRSRQLRNSQVQCKSIFDYRRRPWRRRRLCLSSLTHHQWNNRTPGPGVNDNGSEFPGKVSHCRNVVYPAVALKDVEEKDTKKGKVTEGKRTTRGKTSKASKCTDELIVNVLIIESLSRFSPPLSPSQFTPI